MMQVNFITPPLAIIPYCWLFDIGELRFGVHCHNGWCMQVDAETVSLDSEEKCMPLMPILESNKSSVIDFLAAAAISNPMFAGEIKQFPIELLIKHIFHTSFSEYWPEKALQWLVFDNTLPPLFKKELETFSENKTMPQKLRQKAKSLIKDF